MSNGFVYLLDGNNKIIHTVANVSDACMVDTIENRSDVYGVNPKAVDEEHWLFCKYCIDAPKAEEAEKVEEPEEAESLSKKATAVFGEPAVKEEPKPKRTRRSKNESET